MTTVEISGGITEVPQSCGNPGDISGATVAIPFVSNPPCKTVGASTGRKFLTLASASAFVTLMGDGSESDPTQAATIYVRVRQSGFQARLTFANPANPGSPIVSVVPIMGTLLVEPDAGSGYYVTKVELQGSGPVEFYASGAQ